MANPQLGDGQRKGVLGHSSPGLLNVYVLKQDGGQCRLFKRRDNVDALGSYSHVGEAPWLEPAPGRPGAAVYRPARTVLISAIISWSSSIPVSTKPKLA
ncbi:hypothetical protein ACFDR9_003809 [Janthinobacterium sp. CG_23.3]|uniref:hypothetical protein n=1 Tax=Janthinobacterium sp. CG_23.3 TaxID=3349634 RepID=UPI0038D469D1